LIPEQINLGRPQEHPTNLITSSNHTGLKGWDPFASGRIKEGPETDPTPEDPSFLLPTLSVTCIRLKIDVMERV
jgi:hypothetical protein